MKNKQNETAMEIAKRKSLAEIIQILNSTPSISINPSEKYGESEADNKADAPPVSQLARSERKSTCITGENMHFHLKFNLFT